MNGESILHETGKFSRWFNQLLQSGVISEAALAGQVARPWEAQQMRDWLAQEPITDAATLDRALRLLRRRMLAQWMARDLAGSGGLQEVMQGCTELAEIALGCALAHHARWLGEVHGLPRDAAGMPIEMTIVGMGKLGGSELNVSSDIDLIYLYAEEGQTDGPRPVSHHQFFVSLAQRVARTLAAPTGDGFVFRVDARLRPWGDSGPLAMGYAALEDYLTAHGREWERYAWIKARAITGSRLDELFAIVRPFVYRKYLDFGAISALRALHAQIRRDVVRRDRSDNIKLGPGGIREIEFTVQVFQLIRGGQEPALQGRSTLGMLPVLGARGLLEPAAVQELELAYVFLRNLEHRLQYLDDAQTQILPATMEDRQRIATAMGYADEASLMMALDSHRDRVSHWFGEIFSRGGEQDEIHPLGALWLGLVEDQDAVEQLAALGYIDPATVYARLIQVRRSVGYLRLPESSRERFDRLAPVLLQQAVRFPPPDTTLARMMDLLEATAGRAAYLALMEEFPATLHRVAHLCAASEWAAQYLARNPILLDELIDDRLLDEVPDWKAMRNMLAMRLADAAQDTERQMDILRRFRQQHTFHWLAQDVSGRLELPTLAGYLTRLAELVLQAMLPLAWAGVRQRHRQTPDFAIIGYGKLGGRELGYASDLDMVFLYRDDAPDAAEHYARLAQRIITWLTAMTPAGVLYDTDLRLRPDGASGLLVSSVEAFDDYQRHHAWTWEHQALTRARLVAGNASIGRDFERIRCAILRTPRDAQALRGEIRSMRARILAGHRNDSMLFDLKYDAGGMIDVEFIVQYFVLLHSVAHHELLVHDGCIGLLRRCARAGLVDAALAMRAGEAWQYYWRLQHGLRLQNVHPPRVTHEIVGNHPHAVRELWLQVIGD